MKLFLKDLSEELVECIKDQDDNKDLGLEIVKDCGWEDDGKCSYKTVIYKYQDKFWSFWISRTGSYYTWYDYEYSDCLIKVEPKEKIIIEYVEVKD